VVRGVDILRSIREELSTLNEEILNHPYIRDAELGRLPRDRVALFATNQAYIVHHDLRSLAVMLSRTRERDEESFFKAVMDGDFAALRELDKLCTELGVSCWDFKGVRPLAVAYTHYLAWLALFASPGEAALALVVNLPVWGSNVGRLLKAFRDRYGIRSLGFLEVFTQDYRPLEELALPIIERYYDEGRYRLVARAIQAYEKAFWDSIYY